MRDLLGLIAENKAWVLTPVVTVVVVALLLVVLSASGAAPFIYTLF